MLVRNWLRRKRQVGALVSRNHPRGREGASILVFQNPLYTLNRITFAVKKVLNQAQELNIPRAVITPSSGTLQRLDLRKPRLPKSQDMLRQAHLCASLPDRTKGIGAFFHPRLSPNQSLLRESSHHNRLISVLAFGTSGSSR